MPVKKVIVIGLDGLEPKIVEPMLEHPLVEYIGEIGDHEKDEFLGNAMAMLFPIGWPEPFGLSMIEAMACGTPVIAFPCGSVPEIVEDGVSGFIVNSIEEGVEAVGRLGMLSRERCRQVFEERFTAERMARDYVALYERMMQKAGRAVRTSEHVAAVTVPATLEWAGR